MKKSLPFIGGAFDGHYLPANKLPIAIHMEPDGAMHYVNGTYKLPEDAGAEPFNYVRRQFATSDGGYWHYYCVAHMSSDSVIEKLLTNYCPK